MTIAAPLRHRPFRLLFSGQVISDVGDWLDYLALVVLIVYHWHYGVAALAALTVVMALPWAVVAPFSGVWVDRLPRRAVMVTCDVLRAAVVLGLFFAPNIYVLLVLVGLKFTVSTFFVPAQQASIRLTVPVDDLLAATSLSQLSLQATKVLGPSAGGILVAFAGPRPAFLVDSATYVVSALILSRLPLLRQEAAEEGERAFWREFKAGLAYIVQRRALALGIGAMGAAIFLVFTFDALAPLALRSLDVSVKLLGLAIGGIGLGAALGSLAVGQWGQRFHPFALMGWGKVLAGGSVALVGLAVVADLHLHAAIWIPVLVAIGVGAAAILVPYGFVLQSETPPNLMGRVSVTADAVQTVLGLSAPPLGAVVASVFGVGTLFAVAGGGLALLGVVVYAIRPTLEPIQVTPEEAFAAGTEEPASPAAGSVVFGDTSVTAHGPLDEEA